ncbi:hypothetical protein J1605_007472 [Eschrichtius robustus]|uniref:Uncharacterized protein n=1 Tax=Eschrichtius robustus TaxID=9764 RepID=A0AB34GWQ8_ESCRO|nr:hypothetical protein J1605_007472 [Eschrichtius robustus]
MSPLQTAVWGEGACCETGALGIPGTSSHQAPPSHMATTTETDPSGWASPEVVVLGAYQASSARRDGRARAFHPHFTDEETELQWVRGHKPTHWDHAHRSQTSSSADLLTLGPFRALALPPGLAPELAILEGCSEELQLPYPPGEKSDTESGSP